MSTPVVARRDLIFATKTTRQRIQIRIGQPVRDVPTAGGLDWRCPVSITGVRKRALQGYGVDSLQALVDALKLIEVELDARERSGKGRFEWFGWRWHGVPALDLNPVLNARPNKRVKPAALKV
jgi:hypothetical protein